MPVFPSSIHRMWLGGALLFTSLAVLASPRFLPALPPQAAALRELLNEGLLWSRLLFVAAAVLALASGWILQWGSGSPPPVLERRDRVPVAVMAGLFAVALLLRLPNAAESLWWDELNTMVRVVQRGVPVIVAFNADGNNHFLNSLLMFVSSRVFGPAEWALRLPSLLLGSALPPATYWAMRRIADHRIAFVTAALMAVDFRAVAFSDEARGYIGAMLFGVLASTQWVSLWRRFSVRRAIFYVVFVAACSGFVATCMYVPLWHTVATFVCAGARPSRHRSALAAHLPLVITTMWGSVLAVMTNIIVMPQLVNYAGNRAGQAHLPMSWKLLWATLHFVSGIYPVALAGIALAASVAGWFLLNRRDDTHHELLYGVAGPPLFQLLAFTVQRTQSSPRLFVLLVFPFAVGLASLLVWSWMRQPLLAFVLGGLLIAGSYPAFYRFYRVGNPDLRGLARQLNTRDILLAGEQGDMNAFYFPGARWVLQESTESALSSAPPGIRYALLGEDCRDERYQKAAAECGFVYRRRLEDWTAREYSSTQRRPCFVLYERAAPQTAAQ